MNFFLKHLDFYQNIMVWLGLLKTTKYSVKIIIT